MRKIKNSRINKVFYPTIIFVFVLISFIGSIYQLNLHYDGHHHGLAYSMSEDLLSGKLPYKDFFVHYGFLYVLINSFFIKLFNMSISGLYYVSALSYSSAMLLLSMLTKKYTNYFYACLVAVSLFLIHPFIHMPWPDCQFIFFLTLAIYLLSNNNKSCFFASGISFSFALLQKEVYMSIYLFVLFGVFFTYFFLKYKKLVYFRLNFLRYLILGFFIPILLFSIYLYTYELAFFYLKHLKIPLILAEKEAVNPIIFTLTVFLDLVKHSIEKIFFEPYWFFFVVIIFTNIYFLSREVFLRKKKFYYHDFFLIIVSLFAVVLFLTAVWKMGIFKLATGSILGITIIYYLISKIKFSDTKYILNTLIILYLVLGFEFGKSPSNPIYPNYRVKFKNNFNKLEFLKDKKFSKSEWEQLLFFEKKIRQVKKNCPNIEFGTNLTNDVFFTIIMKKNFQVINFIPWYNEFYTYTPKLFDFFDPSYFNNFKYLSDQKSLVIVVGDSLKIKNLINKDFYDLNTDIKYDFYGHKSIQIFLPNNCQLI